MRLPSVFTRFGNAMRSAGQKLGVVKSVIREKQVDELSEEITGQQVWGAPVKGSWSIPLPMGNKIPREDIYEMRNDDTISLIISMFQVAGATSVWTVEADSDVPKVFVGILEKFAKENQETLWNQVILEWFIYGRFIAEKVYERVYDENGEWWFGIKRLHQLLPETSCVMMDNDGFTGIRSTYPYYVDLPVEKSLVLTHERRGDNLNGRPIFMSMYKAWKRHEEISDGLMDFYEKDSGAGWKVLYPYGKSVGENGKEIENVEYARTMAEDAQNNRVVLIWRKPNRSKDQTTATAPDFEIEKLPLNNVSSDRVSSMMYYDKGKVRGAGIPERSVLEGEFGTKADATNSTEYAIRCIEGKLADFMAQINKYVVDPMIEKNDERYVGRIRLVAGPIWQRDIQAKLQFLQSLLGTALMQSIIEDEVDLKALLEIAGIPIRSTPTGENNESGQHLKPSEEKTEEFLSAIEALKQNVTPQ